MACQVTPKDRLPAIRVRQWDFVLTVIHLLYWSGSPLFQTYRINRSVYAQNRVTDLADISKTPIVVKGCTECAQMTNFHSWLGKTPWILTDWLCAGSMHALYQPKVGF